MFELEVRADTMLRIELEVRPVPLDPLDVRTRFVTVRGRVTVATTGRAIFDADIIAGRGTCRH